MTSKIKIILCVLCALCGFILSAAEITARVKWIYDGDTIKVRSDGVNRVIRLWGIDAPECKQPYGKESKKYLIKRLRYKTVRVVWNEQDNYGRAIGKVYLGKACINLEMIKTGNAWVYRKYCQDKDFINAEDTARKAKLGLWNKPNPTPPWTFRHEEKYAKK